MSQIINLQDLVDTLNQSKETTSKAAEPEKYDGTEKPGYFLDDCEMFFADYKAYASTVKDVDQKKIQFVMTHTKDKPYIWNRTKFAEYNNIAYPTWANYKKDFIAAFQKVDDKIDA
jgi:hypothetical protein